MRPPGMGRGQFILFVGCAMASMFLGSQIVFNYYKPLSDLDEYVQRELVKQRAAIANQQTETNS